MRSAAQTVWAVLFLGCGGFVACGRDAEIATQQSRERDIVIDIGPAWSPLGPWGVTSQYGIGRATVFAVNPLNRYDIWLGTAGGGLWVRGDANVNGSSQTFNAGSFDEFQGSWVSHNGSMTSHAIGAVLLDPSSCTATGCTEAWIGTGENSLRRDTYYGDGVYHVHLDNEEVGPIWSWTRLDTAQEFKYGATQKLLRTAAGDLYVALSTGNTTSAVHANVRAPAPTAGFGLHKLSGGTWSHVFQTITGPTVTTDAWKDLLLPTDLEEDPSAPGTLYLGVMNEGIFRSSDAGASWQALNPGSRLLAASGSGIPTAITDASASTLLPAAGTFDHVELAVDKTSGAMLAMFGNCPETLGGLDQTTVLFCRDRNPTDPTKATARQPTVYRRKSDGSWEKLASPGTPVELDLDSETDIHYSRYTHLLEIQPGNSGVYYHGGINLTRLVESSGSWAQTTVTKLTDSTTDPLKPATTQAHLDFHSLQVFPGWDAGSDVYYVASDGGFYYATRKTERWRSLNYGLVISEPYSLAIDHKDEDTTDSLKRTHAILAGLQDNGTLAYNGTPIWVQTGGGDGGEALIQTPNVFYNSLQNNDITRTPAIPVVQHPTPNTTLMFKDGTASGASVGMRTKDYAFEVPYVQDEVSKRIYVGTDVVSIVDGSDAAWDPNANPTMAPPPVIISPQFDAAGHANHAIESDRDVVTAIAIAPSDPWKIYAGLYGGELWRVGTGAQPTPGDWVRAAATGLPNKTIGSLTVHPTVPSQLWVTISDFGVSTVFYSDNSGDSFTPKTTGLIANDPAHVLKIDPDQPARLWLGTDTGVFASTDYGTTWTPRKGNLPLVPVFDIEIDNELDNVFAATHGRGVWMLRDAGPLLTVFEGWMGGSIWDIPINGTGFSCSAAGGCDCTVHLIQDDGDECAVGSRDATGSRIYVAQGDDKLRTDNFGSCTACDGKPVIWGCFNGKCVYNAGGTPTPLTQCNVMGHISTVRVECAGNDPVTDSVGANCPETQNPPSNLLEVDPPLTGTTTTAAPAQHQFSVSATQLASAANGGDAVLCSANVVFDDGATPNEVMQKAHVALNDAPECAAAGVKAVLQKVESEDTSEDLDRPADFRVSLTTPGRSAAQLTTGFGLPPGQMNDVRFTLSGLGVFMSNQLAITAFKFITGPGGAKGGEVELGEITPVGECTMRIATTAGETATQIATAVTGAFNATTTPFPVTCPEQANPRDMTQDGDSVITLLPSSLSVTIRDDGVGGTFGPHGLDIPVHVNKAPVALCKSALLNANGSCLGVLARSDIDAGSFDPDGPTPNCTPSPAGPFALGSRAVKLTCVDSEGASSECTAQVTVEDHTPPALNCPVSVNVPCTGQSGATASFAVTASDNCSVAGTPLCTSASGSTFALGTRLDTCNVADGSGNPASCAFNVTVALGDNPICCPAGTTVILGTSNNDILNGGSGRDCILGRGGQDTINGNGGDDVISGGDGDDIISGGTGNDLVFGGAGQDRLNGNAGNDVMSGGDGDDQCYGGDDNDTLLGGAGQDHLFGENGTDTLVGETGDDTLDGGSGNDSLIGGGLHDVCIGGPGTDTFLTCQSQTQ
jgi:hypothetical protein